MRQVLAAISVLTLTGASLCPPPAAAQTANPETLAEHSHAKAKSILKRASDALGGADALMTMETIRIEAKGISTPRLQSPTPEPPFETGTNDKILLLDFKNRRLRLESFEDEAGLDRRYTTIIGHDEPLIYNVRAHTVRPFPSPPSFERQVASHSLRAPHLLLRQALKNQTSLRALGEDMLEGKPHDVFSFVMSDGGQIAVYVDRKTGLITKSDRLYVDILEGDEAAETIFGDYAGAGIAKAPRSMHVREAGDVALRADLDIDINPEFADSAFEFDAENYERVGPSQPYPKRIEELADGVFVLHSISDPQHNAFAVEFKDYIVVIEAPETSEGGERLIEKAKELIPGKPIRYAAITHHHADHIGGLRSFIAEGASVITTPGNRKIIEALAKAPHDDRLGRNPRPLRLELIENGKRILTDGTRTLEFIDIGPHPHAREMVIAYMPEERLIFQGDVFIVPSNEAPVGPPVASFAAFAKAIDDLGLDVTRIAGAHGRTATMEEFRERMAVTEPAD